ncbi:TraB/GumN family protein [Sphingobium sp. CR28]|uniref:TraB/GumN family protein n=1 Tax=Sphingobium sp. CR28 TaxID=3400272 RepID=UPI003FEE601D
MKWKYGGWRAVIGAAVLVLLMAAGAWHFWLRTPLTNARPALWHMEKDGREAWLFGTIHAVPSDARWLTPAIKKAIDSSDWLWLEVTGLEDERASLTIFERLGRSAGLPPLPSRLDPAGGKGLRALVTQNAQLASGLDDYESWAAALLINARASAGEGFSSRKAGEAVLTAAFGRAGKPAAGLETIEGQLRFFDRLPEPEQRALLAQAVRDAGASEQLLTELYRDWSQGNMDAIGRLFVAGLGQQPALRSMLVDQRNARWASQIDAIMTRHSAVPFIAVGAGHLAGKDNLRSLLEGRGWRLTRVQ